ncbi:hypothetical protein STRAU_5233 [Streptomyces aurantiacus JA 4570]|uniref:Uncharacterized protein n=1 Tax=Streptomyces aurantiacus JA 4570 TaxID=1286094 RepID=S3ZDD2_9ACTN|nr:hypothetical protein STRAU_5233 [Streptomyces aurantiacus JA 4570]
MAAGDGIRDAHGKASGPARRRNLYTGPEATERATGIEPA